MSAAASYVNVHDQKTTSNRPLSTSEMRAAIPSLRDKISLHSDHKIVAVGSTAAKALRMAGYEDFLSVPHPSGRCRKLNDPDFVAQTKNALISFIKG